MVNESGAALGKYGGNDEDGCCESDIESGIMEPLLLDQVNNIQGLHNEITHHHSFPTPHSLHKKPMAQRSRSHSSTELPALALQQQ